MRARRFLVGVTAALALGLSACTVFQNVDSGPQYVPAKGFLDGVSGQVGSYCYRGQSQGQCGDAPAPGPGAKYPVARTTSQFKSEIRWSSISADLWSADGKRRTSLAIAPDGRLGEIPEDQGWAFLTIQVIFIAGDTQWRWSLEGAPSPT
jgi:hypothetical protein